MPGLDTEGAGNSEVQRYKQGKSQSNRSPCSLAQEPSERQPRETCPLLSNNPQKPEATYPQGLSGGQGHRKRRSTCSEGNTHQSHSENYLEENKGWIPQVLAEMTKNWITTHCAKGNPGLP